MHYAFYQTCMMTVCGKVTYSKYFHKILRKDSLFVPSHFVTNPVFQKEFELRT